MIQEICKFYKYELVIYITYCFSFIYILNLAF